MTERGAEEYFQVEQGHEFLEISKRLRTYLRREASATPDSFGGTFDTKTAITAEEFDALTGERMENTGRVAGVFDLDFDRCEFSAVNITDGWKTYSMCDVSAAIYHAARRNDLSEEQQWERFLEKLDGRELTSAGHLSARTVSFSGEITEIEHRLNFCFDTDFAVDELFGTEVCTTENDDWINVYADYDMEKGSVCDTLDVEIYRGDGGEESLSYPLNAAEKEVLRQKMDAYCQDETGMTLTEYGRQLTAEEQTPPTQPVM